MELIDSNNLTDSMKLGEKREEKFSVICNKEKFEISAGRYAELVVTVTGGNAENYKLTLGFEFEVKDRELEWIISSEGIANKKMKIDEISELVIPSKNNPIERIVHIPGGQFTFTIKILTPKSSEYQDHAKISIKLESLRDPTLLNSCSTEITIVATIVALKVQIGKEVEVARDLGNKVKQNKIDYIFSIFVPGETSKLKGYVFVETTQPDRMLSFIKNIKGIKGVVKGEMDISEIMHYMTPRAAVETLQVGNFVELIDGPFKGEKGRIVEIDVANDKIVVELTESLVPIPVTVRAGSVRVIDKE
ncbi:MAG: transcription elongation factor Spt5 [Thermoplasmata archaeon]|jgi:transcriptional antiterminator NusG|nr:transcription elongation factor Spt5 [Thermoplasmata archaeon]